MEFIKNVFKNQIISYVVILLLGIILLAFPIETISIGTEIIAGIFIVAGLANIIYFFIDNNPKNKMDTIYFVISLAGIILGIYTFMKPLWLITVINIIVGCLLIIGAINNLRYLFKYKVKNYFWWIFTILSFVILILGIVVIINPIEVASIITRLEGASLIFEAIMSLMIMRKFTLMLKEGE